MQKHIKSHLNNIKIKKKILFYFIFNISIIIQTVILLENAFFVIFLL